MGRAACPTAVTPLVMAPLSVAACGMAPLQKTSGKAPAIARVMTALAFNSFSRRVHFLFRASITVEDDNRIGLWAGAARRPARSASGRNLHRLFRRTGKQISHGGDRNLCKLRIERIAQHELNPVRSTRSQTDDLGLFRGDQYIHDLHLLGLALIVALNIGAGGENLDVLQDGFRELIGSWRIRWSSGHEDIHAHAGSHEAGNTHDLVDSDGNSSHPF